MHITAGLIHALPFQERRVFNCEEAASYVGVSPGHFKKLVEDGAMPAPLAFLGRVRRWDKAALNKVLDMASGTTSSTGNVAGAYEAWSSSRG
ncbi:MAG: helix-turn-helix transcriptional regulator [Devosia sp.]